MPHRATYFFPRQFSGGPVTNSSLKSEDHEKLSKEISDFENNGDGTSVLAEGDRFSGKKNARSHMKKKKPLATLVSWLEDEKRTGSSVWGHVRFSQLADHDKNTYHHVDDDDHSDLLPLMVEDVINDDLRSNSQETNIDDIHHQIPQEGMNVIDKQVSNGSRCYSAVVGKHADVDGGTGDDSQWSLVGTWCKTYYTQLTLAKRLTHQTTIGEEPTHVHGHGYEGGHGVVSYDAESVSYRLWV